MSIQGTASYAGLPSLPSLVAATVASAEKLGFEHCVRPEIGRFLAGLAAGLNPEALVGETGTGTGTGLAWMVSAAPTTTRFVSFEIDPDRAAAAQQTFVGHNNVEIVLGDASRLLGRGPFDLLVLDGGPGAAKSPGDTPVDPKAVLRPAGTLTVDDFTPARTWPPRFDGAPDQVRMHWLDHPDLRSTEIQVADDLAVVVGRYWPHETKP